MVTLFDQEKVMEIHDYRYGWIHMGRAGDCGPGLAGFEE